MKVQATSQNNHSGGISIQKVDNLQDAEILIIEDESLMSALMQRYIKTLGSKDFIKRKISSGPLRVLTLESGWELLNADLSHIKVAVIDILLPQVTGVDLVRDFRKRYPGMGLVPVTGMATDPMQRSIQELLPPGFGILSKPLRREDFLNNVVNAWAYAQKNENAKAKQPNYFKVPARDGEGDSEESTWTAGISTSHPVAVVKKRKLPKKAA